jgi:hypothetical protein
MVMIIQQKFKLVSHAENILKIPKNTLRSLEIEENSPRHIFAFLTLKQGSIKHFAKDKIMRLVSDINKRKVLQTVRIDQYPLSFSYNKPTKGFLINLAPFDANEIANLSPHDLYAAVLSTYVFSNLIIGKSKIPELYSKSIVGFLTSVFIRVFGKDFGLTETYAGSIPKLKFLIACYIYGAFFGYKNNTELLRKASSIAPYRFKEEEKEILKYDYSDITQFLKALSDLRIMPGLKVYGFTTKIYRFFGIDFLAGMEDLSRFISAIAASSVTGSGMVPSFIAKKFNERKYNNLIDLVKRVIR